MEKKTVELDVRGDLKEKKDPFEKIMETIKDFSVGDCLVLHAPFKPTPLLGVLKNKGFDNSAEEIASDHWKVVFKKTE